MKRYVYEHARRPAYDFERQLREWNIRGVWKPEDYMIAVTGDPLRNNAYVFAHNAFLG